MQVVPTVSHTGKYSLLISLYWILSHLLYCTSLSSLQSKSSEDGSLIGQIQFMTICLQMTLFVAWDVKPSTFTFN